MRIVVAGHVDHGKSTLIARLLHETGSLPHGKVEELEIASRNRGVPFEWSFALDALQDERDQAVTIDVTRVQFAWAGRTYTLIDAPGHREFVRNALSGAADSDAAILVVDCLEGVSEQTRRHARLLSLLGVAQIIVLVNKMDACEWQAERFAEVRRECEQLLDSCELDLQEIIPISAREGENLVTRSAAMPWFTGHTLLDALAELRPAASTSHWPLRLRVQDVYREEQRRIIVGRLDSGTISAGDSIIISPVRARATVRSIERWNAEAHDTAVAGESIGFTLSEPVYVTRGDLISGEADLPGVDYGFRSLCFWLSEHAPVAGEQLTLQIGPTLARVAVAGVEGAIDSGTLRALSIDAIEQYAVIDLRLRATSLLAVDDPGPLLSGSKFALLRGREVVAGGRVTKLLGARALLTPSAHLVTRQERSWRNGHSGAVIWLTGLSGSGKSTLAMALESRLFRTGSAVYVLDGDNIRSGLNSDLGFSSADRAENIRRISEVAALFADAGNIVIAAFISPMARDREQARKVAGSGFHEIFVRADLNTCERRDPKGLYKRARAGEIADFTGISAPYEPPSDPELIIDTVAADLGSCVEELFGYVQDVTRLAEEAAVPKG
jgi:bifunctional enzyme CysN/CysC